LATEEVQPVQISGKQALICKRAVRLTLRQIKSEIPCESVNAYRYDDCGTLSLVISLPSLRSRPGRDLPDAGPSLRFLRSDGLTAAAGSTLPAKRLIRALGLQERRRSLRYLVQPLVCHKRMNGILVISRRSDDPVFSANELARLSIHSRITAAALTNLETAQYLLKANSQLQRSVRHLSKSVEAGKERAAFQKVVAAVGKSVSGKILIDRVIPVACRAIVESGDIDYCGLAVIRGRCIADEYFAGRRVSRRREKSAATRGLTEADVLTLKSEMKSSRGVRLLSSGDASQPLRKFLRSRNLKSALVFRLNCGRGYSGIAVFGYLRFRESPSRIERNFLRTLTMHLCQGIGTALMYEEIQSNSDDLERRNEDLSVLFELGRKLSSTFDMDTTLDFAVNTFVTRLGVDRAAVIYVDPEDERRLRIAKAVRPGTGVAAFDVTRIKQDSREFLSLAAGGKMLVASDMSTYRVKNAYVRDYFREIGLKSAVAMPLVSREHRLGLLFLGYTVAHNDINERQRRTFEILGSMIATAMENCRLMDFITGRYRRAGWLSTRVFESQETERRKIARNLHDQIGAELAMLRINLQMAKKAITPQKGKLMAVIKELDSELNNVISQVRNLTADLRPPMLDDLGLVPALSWFVNHFSRRTGIRIDFVENFRISTRSPELEAVIYRIVQETLTNAAKHAESTRVKVSLSSRFGECTLIVSDNGKGFDTRQLDSETDAVTGFGLASIRQQVENRGGKFLIRSESGRGTQIKTRIPWLP
jgi:signal transduction histidine kinase